jgi:hypothetical protein
MGRRVGSIAFMVSAVLVFIAGLMLDTEAVMRVAAGWIIRLLSQAPLKTSLVVVTLTVVTLFLSARPNTKASKTARRRPKPKARNGAKPARVPHSDGPAKQQRGSKKPQPEEPDPDGGAAVAKPQTAGRRRKPTSVVR